MFHTKVCYSFGRPLFLFAATNFQQNKRNVGVEQHV